MSIETVSLIIAAFVSASLCIAALMRNFKSKTCLYFALFTALLFIHDTLCVLVHFDAGSWVASSRFHSLIVLMLGPSAILLFQRLASTANRWSYHTLWLYGGLIALWGFFALDNFSTLRPWVYVASHVAFVFAAAAIVQLLFHAEKKARLTREKLRLRYALWGAIVTVAFYVTDAMYFTGTNVPPLGTIARVIFILFIFQTFIQKEFVTAEEVLGKLALFGGIAFTLSAIYFVLVSWVGSRSGLFFFNSLIASFVIIILFDPIRKLTSKVTRRLFVHRNTQMEVGLEYLSTELRGVVEPNQIEEKLRQGLEKILGVQGPRLFLLDRDELSYVLVSSTGEKFEVYASDPLVEYMSLRRGRPFVLESIENDRDAFYASQPRRFFNDCERTMRRIEADVILPFFNEARVVGFCSARTGEKLVLSNEQLRLLLPVGRQIALQLKSAQTFRELSHRDKLAAAGEMAAGLAHEIKNPLGAIKGAAQLLGEPNQGENSAEFIKIIIDETDRLSAVLSDFLEYARPRRGEPSYQCDLRKVAEHTAALIERDSGVQVEVKGASVPMELEADPEILKQVLLNLLMNAVHATREQEEPPKVQIRLRSIEPRFPWFSLPDRLPIVKRWEGWDQLPSQTGKSFVEVSVLDNGVGVSAEDMSRIFVPFFTTKPKGTGLGLAVCQRLVEAMGGSINVRPNQGKGSVFTIHLPVKRENSEGALSTSESHVAESRL
ncbi:MAG: ATP-binding protein [Bdellovibrionota bacterium]